MRRILIVDDEEFLRHELERILGEEGYSISGVETGGEALELTAKESVDLVLLAKAVRDTRALF